MAVPLEEMESKYNLTTLDPAGKEAIEEGITRVMRLAQCLCAYAEPYQRQEFSEIIDISKFLAPNLVLLPLYCRSSNICNVQGDSIFFGLNFFPFN